MLFFKAQPRIVEKLQVILCIKKIFQKCFQNRFPSEAIFVKDPHSTDEDGGVLLSTVISSDPSDPIYLLVLDAKNLTELARAEVNFGCHFRI